MRIPPSDFPLLDEMMGGSLYMSLSTRLSWIKCLFLIKMFLRFSKGRIFFQTSLFFCKTDLFSVNLTSEVIFSMRLWGFKMCADLKYSLVVKSLAFVNSCIQKVNLFIRYFSRKFNWRVMPVCKSNEFIYLLPLSSPQWEKHRQSIFST